MTVYNESFDKVDGALGPDLAWTIESTLFSTYPTVVSQRAQKTFTGATDNWGGAIADQTLGSTDMYEELDLVAFTDSGNESNGVLEMVIGASSLTFDQSTAVCYRLRINLNPLSNSTNSFLIARCAPSETTVATNFVSHEVIGHRLRFQKVGGLLGFYIDDTLIFEGTDASPLSVNDQCGFAMNRVFGTSNTGTLVIDNFEMGPLTAAPTRSSDIPFLQANDRYQVVALSKQGTTTVAPEFRYWYANAPAWDLNLSGDTHYPSFHTLDENSDYPAGSVETPFKDIKTGQEDQIDGVFVEFYARPTALTETTVTSTYSVGFTCRVEGVSMPNWARGVTSTTTYATTSGIVVSDEQTYDSAAATHASDTWPNLRSVYFPVRLQGKVRAARVILTDIHLVAIRRIQLMGKSMPNRMP